MKNETGFYHFRCWRGGERKVVGEQLSIFEYQAFIHDGWHIVGFDGRRGTVCILIQDMTITRLDCLAYAIAFMDGQLVNINVNLKDLTSTTTAVTPPP